MRFREPIDDILSSRVKVRVLRLLHRTRGQFTGREISRLVGYSPTHTINALRGLESDGLVSSTRAGRADLFKLNDDNSAVAGFLDPIFRWEQGLREELGEVFRETFKDDLLSVLLYGSAARGEETHDSDIDLLVVVKDGVDREAAEEKASEASLAAGARFGAPVVAFVVTASEYDKKVKSRRGFWKEIPETSVRIYKSDTGEQEPDKKNPDKENR
jgi:predicted nucleotidyltransferase